MRAFVINKFGEPGQIADVPDPKPGEGEVLIRLHAASVNPMDAFVASGGTQAYAETRLPLIPGIDAVGTVESVGPGANGFKPGDEVVLFADTKPFWGEGTFAELVSVPMSAVADKPHGLQNEVAATLPLAGLTALGVADQVEAGPGKVIGTIGATGGVGSWFTQLAALRGATVVAISKPENAEYAHSLGAASTIDYNDPAMVDRLRKVYPAGLDSIVDFSGSQETMEAAAAALSSTGLLVSSGTMVDADAWAARGVSAEQAKKADPSRLAELVGMLADGRLRGPEVRLMSLDDAAQAIDEVGQHHTRGKIVLQIGD
jgi:NADPH:quinone reductase-like Zn-dependent oxidoreductase